MTPKQERFVAEYLIDLNAAQAAIRAGYSKKTAKEQAARLLTKANVAAAVSEGKVKQLRSADLSATRVLQEISRIAFVSIGCFFDEKGNLKPLTQLTREESACLASMEVVLKKAQSGDGIVDRVHKIKLWDKLKALEILAKHFALLTERVEESGEIVVRWMEPGEKL